MKKPGYEFRFFFYKWLSQVIVTDIEIFQKEVRRTGGGAYTSSIDGSMELVLAVLDKQVRPLQNQFDDAAFYFGKVFMYYSVKIWAITLNKYLIP